MLETSFGLTFFLKTPKKKTNFRYIYLRATVDGVPKEMSTKRKWSITRWDQESERAVGTKEDARSLNFFLDSLESKINRFRTELMNKGVTISAQRVIDFAKGNDQSRTKVLEEFQAHNDEILALVDTGEYAKGTHDRFVITKKHVENFILFKFNTDDIEFRELNYEFVKDFEFFLKTVNEKKCSHNTALKYIRNLKKIVLRAIAKEIISKDPFMLFKAKRTKIRKKPLSYYELKRIEDKVFVSERLSLVRDIFIFQCYTGLSYIDVYKLKKENIQTGIDGSLWIMSNRQKTTSETNIPLLQKAIEIMRKYENHTRCIKYGTVLPVKSNQKMNEYLKEIAIVCNITGTLNTHRARRTFGSTITLNNGVPINVVKEMLGHHSVKQTEEYAITEQITISREMNQLKSVLEKNPKMETDVLTLLKSLSQEFNSFKQNQAVQNKNTNAENFKTLEQNFQQKKNC